MAAMTLLSAVFLCCFVVISSGDGMCRKDSWDDIGIPAAAKSFIEHNNLFKHDMSVSKVAQKLNVTKVDLEAAQKYCNELGGKLPEPKTLEDMKAVTDGCIHTFFLGYKLNADGDYVSVTTNEKLSQNLASKAAEAEGEGICLSPEERDDEYDGTTEMEKIDCKGEIQKVACLMDCNDKTATLGRTFKLSIKAETQGSHPCTEQSRIVCEVELEPKTYSEVKFSVPNDSKSYIMKGAPTETQYRKILYQKHGYFRYECEAELYIMGYKIKKISATAFIECGNSQSPEIESQLQKLSHSLKEVIQQQTASENESKTSGAAEDKTTLALAATSVVIVVICLLIVVPILVIVLLAFRSKKTNTGSGSLEDPISRRESDRSRYSSKMGSVRSGLPTKAKSATSKIKKGSSFKSNRSSFTAKG